jgi:hypothetical protein
MLTNGTQKCLINVKTALTISYKMDKANFYLRLYVLTVVMTSTLFF